MADKRKESGLSGLARDLTPDRLRAGARRGSGGRPGFGDLIGTLRSLMDWDREQLAKAARLPRVFLVRLENGFATDDEITVDVVVGLASALDVDPGVLAKKAPADSPAARDLAPPIKRGVAASAAAAPIRLRHAGRKWAATVGDYLHTLVATLTPTPGLPDVALADLTLGTGDGETYSLKAGKQTFGTLEVSPAGIKVAFAEPAKDKTFTFRAVWDGGRDHKFTSIRVVPGQDWECLIQELETELEDDLPDDFECVFED